MIITMCRRCHRIRIESDSVIDAPQSQYKWAKLAVTDLIRSKLEISDAWCPICADELQKERLAQDMEAGIEPDEGHELLALDGGGLS